MNKNELTELLQSEQGKDFYDKIDLHIHSCESDGKLTPYEIIEQAKEQGKKYISVTDHNTVDAYLSTNILREDFVIPGVEFDCLYKGVIIHILGYCIDIDNEEIKTIYAKNDAGKNHNIFRILELREPGEVIRKIKAAGGIAVLAHPCCYPTCNFDGFVRDLVNMGLDGAETRYPYRGLRKLFKFRTKKEVDDVVEKYGLLKTCGSDSHGKKLL